MQHSQRILRYFRSSILKCCGNLGPSIWWPVLHGKQGQIRLLELCTDALHRCLVLPAVFTPSTLFVYTGMETVVSEQVVPHLTIANATAGHLYAYSPSSLKLERDGDPTNVFQGPRTILTRLSSAVAASGEILPIKAPYNHSSYSIDFLGPIVQCRQADPPETSKIQDQFQIQLKQLGGTSQKSLTAFYAFVPAFDAEGRVSAKSSRVPFQAAANSSTATNQLWMTFQRYVDRSNGNTCDYRQYYQVCELWNAMYNLDLYWDNGFQRVTGSHTLLHKVDFPDNKPGSKSNMAQHAYSAVFWVLTDLITGSLDLYEDHASNRSQIGVIDAGIQHTSLLGSSDLDVFFDLTDDVSTCQLSDGKISAQRLQDKNLARNRTLDTLIQELSFNITVSLLHNELLT
jgi:hypothetical protein